MSKRIVSLMAIWFCLSLLVQAVGHPLPESVPATASPGASQLNVELLGHLPRSNVLDLAVHGNRAFVAHYRQALSVTGRVAVIDVSSPSDPKDVVPWQWIEADYDEVFHATYADDDYIYVATDELDAFELREEVYRRDNLQRVCSGGKAGASRVAEMWASGGYLFTAVGDSLQPTRNGLGVMSPVAGKYGYCSLVSTYQAPAEVTAAAYTAGYAYLGTKDGRLLIVDIANPSKPTEKSRHVLLPGGIKAMAAAPGVVYLAQGTTIKIFDVSDPASPKKHASYTNPVAAAQLAATGGYLYAASDQGLYVIDVRKATAPDLAGYYLDTADGGFGTALFLANDLVYSGGPGGMNILRFTSGAQPQSALVLQPAGPGSVWLNGELLPYPCELGATEQDAKKPLKDDKCREAKEGYKLKWLAKAKSNPVYMYLACFLYTYRTLVGRVRKEAEEEALVNLARIAAHSMCREVIPLQPRSPASPVLVIAHESGALRYTFLQEALTTEVKTDSVAIRFDGASTLAVRHEPLGNRSTVRCYSGSLTLTPANASLPAFTLEAGNEVEVTAESVGPITAIEYTVFLPLTVRNTGAGPAGGWRTLFGDGFEDGLSSAWERYGNPGWGVTDCRAAGGSHSLWPAAAGAGAVDPCSSNYPNDVDASLIYGPFDLRGAKQAEVTFQLWRKMASDGDSLGCLVSVDKDWFYGWRFEGGSGAWEPARLDLSQVPTLGDVRGQRQVWLAFAFGSNGSGRDAGAFVDDVQIRVSESTSTGASPEASGGDGPAVLRLPGR